MFTQVDPILLVLLANQNDFRQPNDIAVRLDHHTLANTLDIYTDIPCKTKTKIIIIILDC